MEQMHPNREAIPSEAAAKLHICTKKLVRVADTKFSIRLANAIFMSKMTYGIQAWGLPPNFYYIEYKSCRTKLQELY